MAVQSGDGAYSPVAPLTTKSRKAVGSGLLGGTIYTPPAGSPPLSLTGAIGGAPSVGGGTVTTTMTPLQVYEGDILNDPQSVAAQGSYDTQAQALANARASAIRNAVFQSGWTPTLGDTPAAGYAGDLRQSDLAAAINNPFSQKAQLDLQLSQAQANSPYDLAASGMGRSGAAAIQQGNLSRQYDLATYQGTQDLLNAIYGAGSTYAGGINDANNALNQARAAVAARLQNAAGYSQSITSTDGGDVADSGYPTGYYPETVIPDVVKQVISQISSVPVSANRTGATVQKGRGVISIH